MTNPIDSASQERIDAYLKRLRHALRALPPDEIAEIVREIRGHIVERAEATDSLSEAALTRILAALGNPEDIASLYQSRALVARARASTSPLLILMTTIRWAGMSLVGFVACLFGVLGYVFGLSFLASPILKMLYPDRVGLWVGPNYWNLSLGALSAAERARDHATEVLGWWLVPIGLVAGPLTLILTTLILRWALRFAFPKTSVRPGPTDGSSQ
ncbi:MAG TPA: hypothetical protein VK727_20140 [Steroidobacteraceae bacterium]|nr:hypothetical protein [Steroidobacteraceae bacterium]